jgi:ribonuclease P protein component
MSQSFGPSVRLRASAEFAVVQKTGRRVPGRFVTVLVKANTLDCDRLGVIASRKLGNAVVRNAAKRRLREIFRGQGPDTARARGDRGIDVVVIPRRESIAAPFRAVEADLVAALRKARGAAL